MISITSDGANKLIKSLEEEKNMLLQDISSLSTFVAAITEDPESVRPEFDLKKTVEQISVIDNKLIKIKNARSVFNTNMKLKSGLSISELKFVRGDGDRNKSIANKYYYDLKNFFSTHERIKDRIDIEQFITVKIGEEYYQGYIDAKVTDYDGNITILDWKTSSIYKGDKAKNECGQLVMYAMALHQQGIPYEKIRIAWNFLKYQCVTVQSKKGVKKVREIERCELGEKLQANAKMWLKDAGYSEEQVFEYLDQLVQTNDITVLPEEVQNKYEFHD